MKSTLRSKSLLLALGFCLVLPAWAHSAENTQDAQDTRDAIAVLRSVYQSDRKAAVAEVLDLSANEDVYFWPIYQSYREEMEKIGDELVKLVLEYSDVYPNVDEDRAQQILKEYTSLEKKLASTRASHYKKARKALPATKILRWAQFENRMDAVLRLQLASVVPLAPGGGKPQP